MRTRVPVRRALGAVLATGTLILAGCTQEPAASDDGSSSAGASASPSAAAEEPNELLVLEWPGYDAPDFWSDFQEANPDTDVTFEFGDTDANILSQMEAWDPLESTCRHASLSIL